MIELEGSLLYRDTWSSEFGKDADLNVLRGNPYQQELELGRTFVDPGAAAFDVNAKGITDNLTDSIVRTMFPSTVDATTVKTRSVAAGVAETQGGIGALFEVMYEVKDAAGCTVGLCKLTESKQAIYP
jgi:hypothetical protein